MSKCADASRSAYLLVVVFMHEHYSRRFRPQSIVAWPLLMHSNMLLQIPYLNPILITLMPSKITKKPGSSGQKKKVTKTSKKLEVKRSAKCWHNIVQKLLTTAIRKKATKKSKSSLKTDKSTYNHRIYLEKIAKNRQIY